MPSLSSLFPPYPNFLPSCRHCTRCHRMLSLLHAATTVIVCHYYRYMLPSPLLHTAVTTHWTPPSLHTTCCCVAAAVTACCRKPSSHVVITDAVAITSCYCCYVSLPSSLTQSLLSSPHVIVAVITRCCCHCYTSSYCTSLLV